MPATETQKHIAEMYRTCTGSHPEHPGCGKEIKAGDSKACREYCSTCYRRLLRAGVFGQLGEDGPPHTLKGGREPDAVVDYIGTAWMDRGACVGSDPQLFVPMNIDQAEAAAGICRRCPVRQTCHDWAEQFPNTQRSGTVWAGVWYIIRDGGDGPRRLIPEAPSAI